ncbi:hypothetical protein BJY54_001751 [Streptomyces nodosus]|nr:hypothetical protein [Streptomyces nodosus]
MTSARPKPCYGALLVLMVSGSTGFTPAAAYIVANL